MKKGIENRSSKTGSVQGLTIRRQNKEGRIGDRGGRGEEGKKKEKMIKTRR